MDPLQRARGAAGCAPASREAEAVWGVRRTRHAPWRWGASPNSSPFCPHHRWHLTRGLVIQETQVVDFNVEGCTKAEEGEEGSWEDGERETSRWGQHSSGSGLSLWLVRPRVLSSNTPGAAMVASSKRFPSALTTGFSLTLSSVDHIR